MPRESAQSKPLRLLRVNEVCERLGISRRTFDMRYRHRFSDRRPADRRTHRVPVLIPEDEVDVAVSEGWERLELFRQRHKRT